MPAPFRRPASLSSAAQDLLPGEPDPAVTTDLAHRSAQALVAGVRKDAADADVIHRVLTVARTEGLDDLAELWSSAPAATLPGALWRLYVVHSWVHRDPENVVRRYAQGSRTVPGLRFLAGLSDPPDVPSVLATIDQILRGAFTGDLAVALRRAGALMMLVSYGSAHLADDDHDLDRQHALTRQASRLLKTGEELVEAARLHELGKLS